MSDDSSPNIVILKNRRYGNTYLIKKSLLMAPGETLYYDGPASPTDIRKWFDWIYSQRNSEIPPSKKLKFKQRRKYVSSFVNDKKLIPRYPKSPWPHGTKIIHPEILLPGEAVKGFSRQVFHPPKKHEVSR